LLGDRRIFASPLSLIVAELEERAVADAARSRLCVSISFFLSEALMRVPVLFLFRARACEIGFIQLGEDSSPPMDLFYRGGSPEYWYFSPPFFASRCVFVSQSLLVEPVVSRLPFFSAMSSVSISFPSVSDIEINFEVRLSS